jgi:hypothetical protein
LSGRLLGSVQQVDELVAGEFGIAEDLAHEAWADGFAGVYRHHGGSPIWMLEKVMTSFDADDLKANFPQGPHDLGTCQAG